MAKATIRKMIKCNPSPAFKITMSILRGKLPIINDAQSLIFGLGGVQIYLYDATVYQPRLDTRKIEVLSDFIRVFLTQGRTYVNGSN